MTKHTRTCIGWILISVLLFLPPTSIISILGYLYFYVLIATTVGGDVLEDPVTLETTAFGYAFLAAGAFVLALPALLSIYSLIASKLSKGKQQPMLAIHKLVMSVRLHHAVRFVAAFGVINILLAALSLTRTCLLYTSDAADD